MSATTLIAESFFDPTGEADERIQRLAHAWMRHLGYTYEGITESERTTHQSAGCEWDGNHLTWVCDDEYGKSNHPGWDDLIVASEMAAIAVEELIQNGADR